MTETAVIRRVKFATTRFGLVEVDEDKIVHFVDEIPGFPEAKQFVLIPHGDGSLLSWLQSVELPEVAFVVTDPWLFFGDYQPVIGEADLERLGISEDTRDSLSVLSVLTVPGDPSKITANLQAPVVINLENNRAKQVILLNDGYTTKHPLLPGS